MRIAIISKARHGPLLEWLGQMGMSQAAFAEMCGLSPTRVGELAGLKFGRVSDRTLAIISEKTGIGVSELAPPELRRWLPGRPLTGTSEIEVPESVLLDMGMAIPQIEAPDDGPREELREEVMAMLSDAKLTDMESEVITRRFGIDRDHEETLADVGKAVGRTREGVRKIEERAIWKLRKSSRKERKSPREKQADADRIRRFRDGTV